VVKNENATGLWWPFFWVQWLCSLPKETADIFWSMRVDTGRVRLLSFNHKLFLAFTLFSLVNLMKHFLLASLILAFVSPLPAFAQDLVSAKRQMIQQSIQRYPGNCPCPYNRASNGSRCGGRSAWSRPGGRSPICYADDITDAMVRSWMARNNMQVTRPDANVRNPNRQTVLLAQTELNRLGCNVGAPDGIIGPRSRAALREFSIARGIEFNVSNLGSQLFLRRMQAIQTRVCG